MSKDYARSLDKIHHKILLDLTNNGTGNNFCADCGMRSAHPPGLRSRVHDSCKMRGAHVCGAVLRSNLGECKSRHFPVPELLGLSPFTGCAHQPSP